MRFMWNFVYNLKIIALTKLWKSKLVPKKLYTEKSAINLFFSKIQLKCFATENKVGQETKADK